MSQLEIRYSSSQEHQIEAVQAVVDLFRGQQFMARTFTASYVGAQKSMESYGHANGLRISGQQLIENLHEIQESNCIRPSMELTDGRLRDFTIEMETGTGKTYVYIRTIYELYKRYGLTKYVIVVPSVAIREGVLASFKSMKKHFDLLYDKTPLDYFVYDSHDMGPVNGFATSSTIQVMVINIQAFNKGFKKDGSGESANIFHRPSEKTIGGRSPREVVAECNPIVIIDEPQSVDNSDQSKGSIRSLNPLAVLRYSATHKKSYNMIYRLTPVDAFQRNLVKGIVVDSVEADEDMNGAYIRLDSTKYDSGYSAKLTIDVRQKDGTQKRKAITARTGTDLYMASKENTDYEAGWVVSNISAAPGDEWVEFVNGELIRLGEALGDVSSEIVKKAQIKATIEDHLERQLQLYDKGIKVLSLFFIDKVENYSTLDGDRTGVYAQWFNELYAQAVNSPKWQRRYERAGVPLETDPTKVHNGYFSQDGKTKKLKETKEGASAAADETAFKAIMQSKERLISFPDGKDEVKDIAFIWSHSALREGWDNPNVFQICTLLESKNDFAKRQKIGRGLRLPVDQNGERSYDADSNILTVIASESFKKFSEDLQRELEKEDFKFGILTPESFSHIVMTQEDGTEEKIGYKRSEQLYQKLAEKKLVTADGSITEQLRDDAMQAGKVDLPPEMEAGRAQIEAVILRRASKLPIGNKKDEVEIELKKDVSANPAFMELWNRICQRTRYAVEVDSERIIADAAEAISKMPRVMPLQVRSTKIGVDVTQGGVKTIDKTIKTSVVTTDTQLVYDLPDPIAELQDAVGLTRSTIKKIIERSGRFNEFKVDPATWLKQVGAKITLVKNHMLADGLKYERLPEDEWYTEKILDPGELKGY